MEVGQSYDLYQIGVDVSCIGCVTMNWYNQEPRQMMILTPSVKTKGVVVVETRDAQLAAAIVNDIRGVKVHIAKVPEKIVKI